MTPQEIFDRVVTHLRKQGKKAVIENEFGDISCLYRTPDGLKCAVGCLIEDDEYDPSFEGKPIGIVCEINAIISKKLCKHLCLVCSLQFTHDLCVIHDWESRFQFIANNYQLVYTPPQQ